MGRRRTTHDQVSAANGSDPPVLPPAEWVDLRTIEPWKDNPKRHPRKQLDKLRASFRRHAWGSPVLAHRETRTLLAGHGRRLALLELLAQDATFTFPGAPGPGFVPLRWIDLPWAQAIELAAFENRSPQDAEDDDELLARVLLGMRDEPGAVHGYEPDEIARIVRSSRRKPREVEAPDGPPAPVVAESRAGEVYRLGPHLLLCGDSTAEETRARLFEDVPAGSSVVLLIDPPYCSGGFQEAGKHAGSIGTRGQERIANDTLSTRGYQALMRRILATSPAGVIYVFTDWRMWTPLWDVSESCGFGVRAMIVWDKESAGMGVGWRHQHELVQCAVRVKGPFDPHVAQGDVIRCKRTGNVHHPTEKPPELMLRLLDVTDMCGVVHDPMAGSGPTLLAAAQAGKLWRGAELSPAYCDVIRRRWTTWAREAGQDPGPGALG